MINRHAYKAFVKDNMDNYYEMFRGQNRANRTDFFNSPEDVEESDTDVWAGLRTETLGVEWRGMSWVRERNQSVIH